MRHKTKIILAVLLLLGQSSMAQKFAHPGLLHSKESAERIQQLVKQQDPTAMGSYQKLVSDPRASKGYQMSGPFDIIARDGGHRRTKKASEDDFLAAYYNALLYTTDRDETRAEKAMDIIRAYANKLTAIDGHDAPLCAGLQGFILINACELLRYGYGGWTKQDTRQTETMFRNAFLPVLDEFDRRSPYANGNWGAAVNKMRMALGVYCNDRKQYQRAVDYYRNGKDNGALPNYIDETGQCQESGRDQAHVMLGLGQLAETCEVAWSQGDNLYGDLRNRLLHAYEYTSRANLGYPVPFRTWKDLTGLYNNWTVLSDGARGQWRAVFEIAYNHYVGRCHLDMPYTSQVLGHFVRPEGAGFTCDNPGFGTLLFYQGTKVDSTSPTPARIIYKVNKRRDYSCIEEPVIRMEGTERLTLVRTVDCWPEYWDLQPTGHKDGVYEFMPRGTKSRNGVTFSDERMGTTFLVEDRENQAVGFSPLPAKDGPSTSLDYDVMVRRANQPQGPWTLLPTLKCNVDTRRVQQASFTEFDMKEPVIVRIVSHRPEQAHECKIRPSSRNIPYQSINDSTIEVELLRPEYLSVEFGGDRLHNLHLLANAPLEERHTPDDPQAICWQAPNSQDVFVQGARLIYFGPGVHRPKDLPGEEIRIPSNSTVYLAPGAVVKARLIVDYAENVRIVGHGILDHPLRGVEITFSKNVLVDGITVLNPAHYTIYGGQSEGITIRNVKSFSARSWSDGIDLMCCSNVKIENCFLRTSDDCIAFYNHRWWFWGGSRNINVSHCIFWPDVAHPVNIGTHGDDRAAKGEVLENVRIHDCDILYGREEGLLAIQCGDQNDVRNVSFDSIRIEGIQKGRLFDLRVIYGEKYNRAPGGSIDKVHFDHITVAPDCHLRPSRVEDYDSQHRVEGYTLGDIKIGERAFDPETDIIKRQGSN